MKYIIDTDILSYFLKNYPLENWSITPKEP